MNHKQHCETQQQIFILKSLIISILLFINITSFSQSWSFSNSGNDFDGKYKYAMVEGSGGEFPYDDPLFIINYFENSRNLNIYFKDVGYAGCDNKIVYLKFDTEDKIYNLFATTNNDKDIWFLSFSGQDNVDLTTYQLLNKLKINSYVSVRLYSNCGQADYKFPLSGSAKAINFVADEWFSAKKHIQDSNQLEQDSIRLEQLFPG